MLTGVRSRVLPISGNRYYPREVIRQHLDPIGKRILYRRSDNKYRLVDYILVASFSRAIWLSSLGGAVLFPIVRDLYANEYFTSNEFFSNLYKRNDLGLSAYYAFLHSTIIGAAVLMLAAFHMFLLGLNARPEVVPVIEQAHENVTPKRRNRLMGFLIVLGILLILAGFTVPSMIISYLGMSETVGSSLIYSLLTYIFLVLSQAVGVGFLLLSFVVVFFQSFKTNKAN